MKIDNFSENTQFSELKKVIISILFGLLGLTGSYFSFNYMVEDFTVTIVWSFIFPLLVALAYGWKYGLISGTLGLGAAHSFLLWPNNGYANIIDFINMTIWFIFHGFFAQIRAKKQSFWNNPLVVYFYFALFYALSTRLLFPIAFSFNPPSIWFIKVQLSIPIDILNRIILKSVITMFFALIFAVTLFKMNSVKKLFGLKSVKESKYNSRIVLASISGGFFIWYLFIILNCILIDFNFPEGLFIIHKPYQIIALFVFISASSFIGYFLSNYMETLLLTQSQLITKSALLETQLDSANSGILAVSNEREILIANKRFYEIWNIPDELHNVKDDVLVLNFVIKQIKNSNEFINKVNYLYSHTGEISNDEFTLSDGRVFQRYSAPLIDKNKFHLGRIWFFTDMTQNIKMQQIIIQSEKMQTVGNLASGMAHEINNPLGAILQGAQNTLRRLSPDNEANRQTALECGTEIEKINKYLEERNIFKYLEGMRSSAIRTSNIVANMLNFTKKCDYQFQKDDINFILQNALNVVMNDRELKAKYNCSDIEIINDFNKSLPMVNINSNEIEQVFINVIKNSVQSFTGSVTETKKIIQLKTETGNNDISITIEDNGCGMEENVKNKVFEPFYTTRTVGFGTGLGLSTVYFIINKNHNGSIHLHSEPDKGTKVVIHLPV